jgi:hypothetical protein
MLFGSWLLLSAVLTPLPAIIGRLEGQAVTSTSWVVACLKTLLLGATGLACLWAGKQRFTRVADRPDFVERLATVLKTPRVLAWMLGSIVAVITSLILMWPWIDSVSTVQLLRESSGIQDMNRIHDLHGSGVGDWGFVSGRVEPIDVAPFITHNHLLPASDWDSWRRLRMFGEWERHWPVHPDWYAREGPRPNDTCKMHCKVLCMLDRGSGRVWIALRGPDFGGD